MTLASLAMWALFGFAGSSTTACASVDACAWADAVEHDTRGIKDTSPVDLAPGDDETDEEDTCQTW